MYFAHIAPFHNELIYMNQKQMWSEHLRTLRLIFEWLRVASFTLNLVKCDLGKVTVTYLGKEVGHGQLRPLSADVQAILDFPVSLNQCEVL